jgi:hypothetical protein
MMLMAFVLREPSILRSSIFGYRRSVVDVAGSVIGCELYVAYFGVLDLGYATPKVSVCVAGCGNCVCVSYHSLLRTHHAVPL